MFYRAHRIDTKDQFTNFFINNAPIGGKLVDISLFGCKLSFENSDDHELLVGTFELKVLLNGYVVFSGKALKVHANNEMVGIQFSQGTSDINLIKSILRINKDEHQSIYEKKDIPQVNDEFKVLTSDLCFMLSEIREDLNTSEREFKLSSSFEDSLSFSQVTIDNMINLHQATIFDFYQKLGNIVIDLPPLERNIHKEYFRAIFHPIVLAAPFIHRAFEKPLGYARDYGLMNMLYNYEDLGPTLFDRFFHRLACNEPVAIANKDRVVILSDELIRLSENKSEFKVSIVACGPCRELELYLQKLDKKPKSEMSIEFICIDSEEQAISFAYSRINTITSSYPNIRPKFLKTDPVTGLIKKKQELIDSINESDVIISSGFFDYLSDKVAKGLVASFSDLVKDDGTIIISNVAKGNPSIFSMSFLTEWEMVLRDEEDMRKLIPEDSKKKHKIIKDLNGVNYFLSLS